MALLLFLFLIIHRVVQLSSSDFASVMVVGLLLLLLQSFQCRVVEKVAIRYGSR